MHGRTECSYPGEFKCLTNKCIIAYGDQMVVNSGPDWETHAMNIWSSTTACGGFYFSSFFLPLEKQAFKNAIEVQQINFAMKKNHKTKSKQTKCTPQL